MNERQVDVGDRTGGTLAGSIQQGACQAWREDTHNGALINGAFGAARL
jgi:hypothetical protein